MLVRFANPNALWLLLLLPIAVYLYIKYSRIARLVSRQFPTLRILKRASKKSLEWRKHFVFYSSLFLLLLLVIALADPHIPLKKTKEGVNVVLVIDVSGSMRAQDYKPSRIEAAKRAAITLVKSLKQKDYVGVVVFESGATSAAYLTPLKDRAIRKIKSIEAKEGRTALGDGLALGIDMASSIPNRRRVVILLSDGVSNAGVISPQEAVVYAKDEGIQVYTVGMGSEKPVVLGYDFFGNPQYAELDENTLKMIAQETGGKYYRSVNEKTLEEIYRRIGKNIKREKELASIKDWFLYAAVFLLALELFVRYGSRYRVIS